MLKVGVIGAGYLGKKHLKILENSSFFDLIGFYDENENIKKISQKIQIMFHLIKLIV